MPASIGARWLGRLGLAWRDAFAASLAAALAWMVSVAAFGHSHPVFAAVTALVCLAPGLPSHGRQAVGLMLGVTTGIVVGELALLLPDTYPLLRVGLGSFLAILIAAGYGQPPVVPIQAGVSAVLVLAVGPAQAGLVRYLDVAVGTTIGLVFSQILMTPDPVRQIDDAARDLLRRLAEALQGCRAAVEAAAAGRPEEGLERARAGLQAVSAAHASLIGLHAGIAAAQGAARWSLRGRLTAPEVRDMAARYDRRGIRLYASALLFAEGLANTLRREEAPPPPELGREIDRVARICAGFAAGLAQSVPPAPAAAATAAAPGWRHCAEQLQAVAEVLAVLGTPSTPARG